MKKYIITLIICVISSAVYAEKTDLTKKKISVKGNYRIESNTYVRRGFSKEWTNSFPEGDKWIYLENVKNLTAIRLPDPTLKIPGIPERNFLSFKTHKAQSYTFIMPFELKKIPDFPGLLMKEFGINYEIFINGKSIFREIHLDRNGNITSSRSKRNLLCYVNPSYLRKGQNIAAFRIIGDPTNPFTGFYRIPVYFGDYRDLEKLTDEIITLILISIYLIIGIFHISLFVSRPTEKFNLFYGLASIAYFLYIFLRTKIIFSIIPNSQLVSRLELAVLYSILPLFGAFLELITKKRISLVTKIYSGFCGLMIAVTIPVSDAMAMNLLSFWQVSASIMFYYAIFVMGIPFRNSMNKCYEAMDGKNRFIKKVKALGRTLIATVPGNLMIGMVVVIACIVFDIIDAAYLYLGLSISQYGIFFLITGIAFILSNRFIYIHKKIEKLNVNLEQKIDDLNKANELITFSEERYRLLVEGSDDIIFTLDETLAIRSVNKAIRKKLNMDPEALKMTNFIDFIKEGSEGQSVEYQYVLEKLDELKEKKKPVYFKMSLKRPSTMEPVELQVKLEHLDIAGRNEILGKAANVMEDSLLKYFKTERSVYTIGNYLTTAEEISHRITRNLPKYISQVEANMVRLALREILINAIEHGNLEISFDDKTQAQVNDTYFKLVSSRQKEDKYRDREVEIEFKVNNKQAVFKITDEGNGFNHRAVSEKINSVNDEMLEHGRGLVMAYNVFDRIQFNSRGNQVLLIKNIESAD